ncbi:MAG TPA: nodulation protein NfeD [Gaiellaceae bacterium]|nr:nodulation protein NfeD [Gaiellaceae bacterium]
MTVHRRATRAGAATALALGALVAVVSALVVVGTARSQGDASSGEAPVVVVELDVAIDNVSARFLRRALNEAKDEGATVAVVRVDTPGGLLDATRDMVGTIFGSDVPVVSYVAPEGAQAASAGTFVASAAALVAMAPATNIGAASVVGAGGEDLPETLSRKATEDAAALIRSIAARRDRPVAPLEATVREATSYSALEAVELGIADLVAADLDRLLADLDGRSLDAASGAERVHTAGAEVRTIEMNVFERVLAFLADPNIAFLLISLGALALAVEIWSPGLWVPGALGVVFLVLGFAGIGFLPFSWAAVVLLGLAVLFFVLEALNPGIGLFGAFGTAGLVLGGIFLLGGSELPGQAVTVSPWLLATVGVLAGLFTLLLVREMRVSQRPAYVSPYAREGLLGEIAEVTVRLSPTGEVRAAGETWGAELRGGGVAEAGERVRVSDLAQLGLVVERIVTEGPAQAAAPAESPETGR